jgi:hypothetical protein
MDGNFVGLVAVMMIFGIALAAMYIYTFFHMRKLCREERLAAITRGDVPMQAELSEAARSPRSGILLVAGAIGYFVPYLNAARGARGHDRGHVGPDGLTVGIGFFCRSRSQPAGWENIVKGKGRTERKLTENGRPRTRGESMLAQNWHRTRDVQYSLIFRFSDNSSAEKCVFALRICT